MNNIIGDILIIISSIICLFGCIGLVRFDNIYMRLQSVLKCVAFGIFLLLVGIFIKEGLTDMGIRVLLCSIFIGFTIPIIIYALAQVIDNNNK